MKEENNTWRTGRALVPMNKYTRKHIANFKTGCFQKIIENFSFEGTLGDFLSQACS